MGYTIPFNRPTIEGDELAHVEAAIKEGRTSSGGPYSKQVCEILTEAHNGSHVLLTTSCTDALELAALLLEIGPGDAVIVPSYTFVSTALAFARAGAHILFADIEPITLGLDPAHVQTLIRNNPEVRAVVTVHYAGVAGQIESLQKVLDEHPQVDLIEDNAHGLFGLANGRPLGTLGRMSTLSFHETKNFICGEGGALVLNDHQDIDRAHVLLDKGTNRRAFMNGEVDKYTWVDTGSSFGLSDMLAAFLLGQLERRGEILRKRQAIFEVYSNSLSPFVDQLQLQLPTIPDGRQSAYHMFHLLARDETTRDTLLGGLRERGMQATFHYVPLHSSPAGRDVALRETACPVSAEVSRRLVRLPFFNALGTRGARLVAEAVIDTLS